MKKADVSYFELSFLFLVGAVIVLLPEVSLAQANPFDPGIQKADDMIDTLRGPIARIAITGAMLIAGIGALFGKISKPILFAIIGGGILILIAPTFAEWITSN